MENLLMQCLETRRCSEYDLIVVPAHADPKISQRSGCRARTGRRLPGASPGAQRNRQAVPRRDQMAAPAAGGRAGLGQCRNGPL